MKRALQFLGLGSALLLPFTTLSRAAVSLYTSRASFDAAFPGLPVETFEAANVTGFVTCTGPIDKFTSNGVFLPGQILDGLRITAGFTPNSVSNIYVPAPGNGTYTSHAISYNYANTTAPELTVSLYNGNVTMLGLDVTSNPNGNNVTLQLFSSSGSLGSYLVSNAQGSGTFIGFFSTDPILSVQLSGSADYFGVDNIAFAAVPEPNQAALLALGVALAGWRRLLRICLWSGRN